MFFEKRKVRAAVATVDGRDGVVYALVVFTDGGYGITRAGDVIGGFESWKDNGLPIATCGPRRSTVDALSGTGPPE